MLPRTQVKALTKKLALRKEDNTILFLKRLEGWIKTNGNTTLSIAKGINKILDDIYQKEEQKAQEFKKIDLSKVKNKLIEKYAKEIIELHTERGLGVRRIQSWLWDAHRAKISYSSIYRFLKSQNLMKKEQENG